MNARETLIQNICEDRKESFVTKNRNNKVDVVN